MSKVTDNFVTELQPLNPPAVMIERPRGIPKTKDDFGPWLARNLGVLSDLDPAVLAHLDL